MALRLTLGDTTNAEDELAFHPGSPRVTKPEVASAGTVATAFVAEWIVHVLVGVSLKVAVQAAGYGCGNEDPVTVTLVPTGPEFGVSDTRDCSTVKLVDDVAVHIDPWLIAMGPEAAPLGTITLTPVADLMWQAEVVTSLENSAAQDPGNGPGKDDPVIFTVVPSGPESGVNEEITGVVAPAGPDPNADTGRAPSKTPNSARLALCTPDTEFTGRFLSSRAVTVPVDHKLQAFVPVEAVDAQNARRRERDWPMACIRGKALTRPGAPRRYRRRARCGLLEAMPGITGPFCQCGPVRPGCRHAPEGGASPSPPIRSTIAALP
ncbi:MAG: hypothetical protein ACLPVF_01035 [Acidimicrobiales bacterium]